MKKIRFKLNDKEIECPEGRTIMEAAQANGIFIPALCEHPDFPHKANCRVCVVEIGSAKNAGQRAPGKLAASCSTLAQDGMVVRSDTDRVKKSRNLNIEMLFAEHIERCATCIWRVNCRLLDLADRYKILITTFKDRKGGRKTLKFGNAIEIDGTQCIDCMNCVDACSRMQKIDYLEVEGKGVNQEIVPAKDRSKACIYCGQCALHCPVGSAQEQSSWEGVEKALKDGKKTVVAQISSSAIVSVGEEFKEKAGGSFYKQVFTAMRRLGFKYVFDDGLPNMIAAAETGKEMLGRTDGGTLFTSSCPAWVRYAESYHPGLKNRLSAVRPPHIIGGGLIKNFWAKKTAIDPDDMVVVSVLPCTAAKYEITRKDMKAQHVPVDHAITVRELAWLLKKNRIEFKNMEPGKPDDFFEGAAKVPLFGASGGETDAIFSAVSHLSKSRKDDKLEQIKKDLYREAGVKAMDIELAGRKWRTAVVNGIGNIKEVLGDIEKYDFVEVRACPGGCVGGGGQAFPTDAKARKTRLAALRRMDKDAGRQKDYSGILKWAEENGPEK